MYTLPPNTVAGSISFSQYLDITRDVVVSFDYACYGPLPTGNEGFCVFFGNSFSPVIFGGGPGPGLAYSSVYNIDNNQITPNPPLLGGITCGIIGIGFDITGNFGSDTYSKSGYPDIVQNTIALRSTYDSNFNIITRTPNLNDRSFANNISIYQQITGNDVPIFKRVRVRLTDFGQRIVVDMKTVGELNFTNYLNYNFTNYNNSLLSSTDTTISGNPLSSTPVIFTPTIRCGLGFSTGQDTNTTFKIKNFNVNGVFTTKTAQGTYTYKPEVAVLSATQTYSNPAYPYFFAGEQFRVVNNYAGHVTTNPMVTAHPLVLPDPFGGAPYVTGDPYVIVV